MTDSPPKTTNSSESSSPLTAYSALLHGQEESGAPTSPRLKKRKLPQHEQSKKRSRYIPKRM
jgi:hypothetical protein